jgi:hypothetical protein
MKQEALAVLVLAREKAKAVKPKVCVPAHKPTQPTPRADDGREAWSRFKSECVLLTKKGGVR